MSDTTEHEYLILGAGPAGLQAAYFLQGAGRDYRVLERGATPGEFFRRYPRHRKLISINKLHTGHCDPEINYRWDWNSLLCADDRLLFRNYSDKYFPAADDMVRYLSDFASSQGLAVDCGVEVERVTREGEGFALVDRAGTRRTCQRLIVATGIPKTYDPPIPGIELVERYDEVSVDPQDFVGQRVLIIGKGNSGFETADNLIDTTALIHIASPRPVKFAWQTHHVGHLRAVNNNLLDTYLLKCQNATLEVDIERIERNADGRFVVHVAFQRAAGSRTVIEYDRVIACTGFRFDASIFAEDCRPELMINDRFPRLDSTWQSTNVPGLYFAGTLMQSRDFKKTTSGFIHGFRYNVRALAQILELQHHGVPHPARELDATPTTLTAAVLDRVNRSSALWQQFGFLADILVPDREQGVVRYHEALPVAYVHEHPLEGRHDYYTVTLEYGFHEDDDPFRSTRVSHTDADNAAASTFLHPIVRRFRDGQLVDEQHIVENLEAVWRDPELHIAPLERFFARTLPETVSA